MLHAQMPDPLPTPEFPPYDEPPATDPSPIEDPLPGEDIPSEPTPDYLAARFPIVANLH